MEIRPATKSDIPTIMQLERLDGYDRVVGRWEAEQHASEIETASNRYFVGLDGSEIAAFAILQNVGAPNRSIRLRRIIAKNPGRGDGSRFLRLVLQICFDELGAHRVDLFVHMENERARRVYARTGFFEEGILRDCHRDADGSFRSMRLMSMLKPEWAAR
jgi:ribosomal protein S18 acetylase RimI-like enzyme